MPVHLTQRELLELATTQARTLISIVSRGPKKEIATPSASRHARTQCTARATSHLSSAIVFGNLSSEYIMHRLQKLVTSVTANV
jgi:hypothetical protein